MINTSVGTYLRQLGVRDLEPRTCPFDPGYDSATLESHIQQSGHLMSSLKLSMACWLIADPKATVRKIQAARARGIPVITGGGAFEIALAQGQLDAYLDICAELGVAQIECGSGFTSLHLPARNIVEMAYGRGLSVQYELGKKHEGPFNNTTLDSAISEGLAWMDAGAMKLVIEARENANSVGLFDQDGTLDVAFAKRFVREFGLDVLIFEAPTKNSQFAFLDHFGPEIQLGNVRIEELLRVEIYRRGLHSDSFGKTTLRPKPQPKDSHFDNAALALLQNEE